ncbi:MAG: CpaF family protein [Candidatus Micrarchaeota archaeon]|nr:CpaF family protein [Candidatus Micrarchaeota archaeon]
MMNPDDFYNLESLVFEELESKLSDIPEEADRNRRIESIAKTISPAVAQEDIRKVIADSKTFGVLDKYLSNDNVEDIMVNNTSNMFIYAAGKGYEKVGDVFLSKKELDLLVKKLKMYATTSLSNRRIFDVHLPNGSRVNIVDSPLGADITIRNFKKSVLSIIDLINNNELSYNLAGRLWLYTEGLKVRPANLLIGGMPASGKTTLLNAMFSFFRPEERVVVLEETYELNTEMQENTVRLETSPELPMEELVKNALRMRPDLIIIGEVRGVEAKDMLTAMNIGKISMGTIHASTARDVITRLEHSPMDIEMDIVPLIDAIIVVSQVNESNKLVRKITQVSEISGIETQVLLSDLYVYDYKTHKSSDVLPSVTYRDTLARLTGYTPTEIVIEEQRRGKILERLNKLGVKDMKGISAFVREYYQDPRKALAKIDLSNLGTLPW